jgi:N-acetylglutamate synthase-like GNAT family acetyltransferase
MLPLSEYDILETWTAGAGDPNGSCSVQEFESRHMTPENENPSGSTIDRALRDALGPTRGERPTDPTVLARSEYAVVRMAHPEDFALIARLIEPFVEEGKVLGRTYQEFDELLPNFFVAIAEEDGEVIGCVALEVYSRKLSEVRSLAVARRAQGKGIGRLLVAACVERARQLGIFEVMAITSSDDFFKSCGFDYTLPGAKRALFMQTRDAY